MTQEIESDMPRFISGTYKLSAEAIKAVEDKVKARFEYLMNSKSFDEAILKKYQERLDEYMMKQYPDLSNRLNSLSLILDDKIKQVEKRLDAMKQREKLLVKSESLYEDFYDLKDRVRFLDDFICTFKSKLKKSFDL